MSFLVINHSMVDTVVFDFDGTLAELNIDFIQMRRAINDFLSVYGLDHHTLKHKFALEIIAEAEAILRSGSLEKSLSFKTEAYRIIEDIEVEAAQKGQLFGTTKELLFRLKGQSIRTGIITRNCAKAVYTVFPDLSAYCPVVVCRDDVNKVKPHPVHLHQVLSRLGSQANSSVMVGDHPLDIETGRNAGALTAGVLTGRYQAHDFISAGADLVLTQAMDLLNYWV